MTVATLPPARWALWVASKSVIRRGVSVLYARGAPLNEVLVVVAADGTLAGQVARRLFRNAVVDEQQGRVVAVLPEDATWSFTRNVRCVAPYLATIPEDCFALMTVPEGDKPGLSAVQVHVRQQPLDWFRPVPQIH